MTVSSDEWRRAPESASLDAQGRRSSNSAASAGWCETAADHMRPAISRFNRISIMNLDKTEQLDVRTCQRTWYSGSVFTITGRLLPQAECCLHHRCRKQFLQVAARTNTRGCADLRDALIWPRRSTADTTLVLQQLHGSSKLTAIYGNALGKEKRVVGRPLYCTCNHCGAPVTYKY